MTTRQRILLIDNEEGLCRLMEQALWTMAIWYGPTQTQSGHWKSSSPVHGDLVVTDIKMPGMSGLDVLHRVKERSPETPVIIITAYATVEMSIQALRKGAYEDAYKAI